MNLPARHYRSSRDDISISSVSLLFLGQKETRGKAVGVTRRMPAGPRLSSFPLVKSIRDPAFIPSSFSSPLLLLLRLPYRVELVTAMDRGDSSRLAFTAFPEYFFLAFVPISTAHQRAIAFFLSRHTVTNPLQISLLIEPWPMQPKEDER